MFDGKARASLRTGCFDGEGHILLAGESDEGLPKARNKVTGNQDGFIMRLKRSDLPANSKSSRWPPWKWKVGLLSMPIIHKQVLAVNETDHDVWLHLWVLNRREWSERHVVIPAQSKQLLDWAEQIRYWAEGPQGKPTWNLAGRNHAVDFTPVPGLIFQDWQPPDPAEEAKTPYQLTFKPDNADPATEGSLRSAIYGINATPDEIVVHVVWREADGWHKVDWIIPAGREGYLEVEGRRVMADTVMHWGESRDRKWSWRADKRNVQIDLLALTERPFKFTYKRTP